MAETSDMHLGKSAPDSQPKRRFVLLLFVPAILTLGLIAAACGNSGDSSPTASANALVSQGLTAETSGQIQQALQDFNAAVAKNPVSPVAYFDLGTIYQEHLSNSTQAATEYNKALLADPNYAPAMYNLATLEASSDPQGAISLYNQLLKLNPKQPSVLFNLGLLMIQQNDQVLQGHAYLKQAIALQPSLASRVPAGITP
jgi:tetratricopeptide (TPR) repeat protein